MSAATEPISHRDLVSLLIEVAGAGRMRYVEWPADKKRIDIGSFYSDSTQVPAACRAGRRSIGLREGLQAHARLYRAHCAE